jgi:hypothetical protein
MHWKAIKTHHSQYREIHTQANDTEIYKEGDGFFDKFILDFDREDHSSD